METAKTCKSKTALERPWKHCRSVVAASAWTFLTLLLAKIPQRQSTPAHPHDAVRLPLVAGARGADLSCEAAEEVVEEVGGWGGVAEPCVALTRAW